ncbi:MAG TPA: hypothetical protein VGB94_14395 [Acidobacteriaceae bacterium]
MKSTVRILFAILFLAGTPVLLCAQGKGATITPVAAAADAGFGPLDPTPPTGATAEQIIAKFAARESEFDDARHDYGFQQNVRVQTLDDDKKVDGEYQQTTDISFTRDGKRVETVVFAPADSLTKLIMTQQDFSDIEHRLPFVLTTADLPDYNVTYLGRQKVDEVDTYVFQAGPKVMLKGRRYFQGKVWVDQQDPQIVLIDGRSVPDDVRKGHEDLSPPFTTYYEQVDGDYWFPTYTKGEGILNFSAGNGNLTDSVHIRQIITYSNYKRFRSRTRVIYNGQEVKREPGADTAKPGDGQPK